jgi:hypothetical protein
MPGSAENQAPAGSGVPSLFLRALVAARAALVRPVALGRVVAPFRAKSPFYQGYFASVVRGSLSVAMRRAPHVPRRFRYRIGRPVSASRARKAKSVLRTMSVIGSNSEVSALGEFVAVRPLSDLDQFSFTVACHRVSVRHERRCARWRSTSTTCSTSTPPYLSNFTARGIGSLLATVGSYTIT